MKSANNKISEKSAAIIALIISLLYLAAIITGNSAILGFMWIIIVLLFGFLMIAITMTAGVIVVKSLFAVAAELSLLIFITQSELARTSQSQSPRF